MPNYTESMIYKLCCKDTTIEEIYIGSTINFSRRKACHKITCNDISQIGYNEKKYKFIRDNGGWDNWDMILIAKVNCNDRLELRKKEREYMEEYNPSLNINKAQREEEEKKEYIKEFHKTNKEKILIRNKEWYENNKLKILIRNKERYKTNKEEKKKYDKEYYETNKEEIRDKAKVKVSCECGAIVRKSDITRHYKSKKHINFINTI